MKCTKRITEHHTEQTSIYCGNNHKVQQTYRQMALAEME